MIAVTAGLLAATALIGCSGHTAHTPAGKTAASAPGPMPTATIRHLPPGVFYLLAGRRLATLQVWQIGPGGRETQLTHNPPGFAISALAASRAGIILADARYGVDDLARWTRHGASWIRPPHTPGSFIHGEAPDIRDDGQIVYETPPAGRGAKGNQDFAIWVRRSFTGSQRIVYQRRAEPGNPVFGPHGEIAIVRHRVAVIISSTGKMRTLHFGAELGFYVPVWRDSAPALAVNFAGHTAAEFFFPSGRREQLPGGWHPLAWSPAGGELLMQSVTSLGIWSVSVPRQVAVIGKISPEFQIIEASWLRRKAPL
jgi:hypothetical protein